uniref:Tetratricopeptide repeat domain 16 n=1 Tax=Seriola dumerili TaxID=41447 RepID=A0A3B4UJX3_SERDU
HSDRQQQRRSPVFTSSLLFTFYMDHGLDKSPRGRSTEAAAQSGSCAEPQEDYEKAVICFSRAITLQPEQLYVSQAEAYLQLCDFQSAAACYKKAWLLEPGAFRDRLAFIYYLQFVFYGCHFVSNPHTLFINVLSALYPSLACLTAAGHLTDCLQLVNDWMVSDGPTSDLYILRARLHQQLHQVSQCYRDVTSALALNPSCPAAGALLQQLQRAGEQARQKSVDRAVSGELPEALCMINIALENCPRDARLYLFRGILYRRLKDFTRGEFQLVLTYNDFAVQCFSRGQYAEATLLLNKAIEEEKSQAGLYLNRGDCFFKQGDWCYALVDYQQAEEMMRPGDPAVRLRLAVLHNTLGSFCFQGGHFQEAADMFSLAVQYDPSAAQYYEKRSKAFRKLQNLKGARQDLICVLILDPTNEEVGASSCNLSINITKINKAPTDDSDQSEHAEVVYEPTGDGDHGEEPPAGTEQTPGLAASLVANGDPNK